MFDSPASEDEVQFLDRLYAGLQAMRARARQASGASDDMIRCCHVVEGKYLIEIAPARLEESGRVVPYFAVYEHLGDVNEGRIDGWIDDSRDNGRPGLHVERWYSGDWEGDIFDHFAADAEAAPGTH